MCFFFSFFLFFSFSVSNGSGFYLVQITQNGWNSANFPDAGATRSGVGSVAVREECWSSASQRHAAICNRTRGGGRAAGWPPALATHLLMWHSPTESNELSLETSCRLVQICASDSRCESLRRCAHGALDQRLILRPGHLRGVRVAAKCGASGLRLTTPADLSLDGAASDARSTRCRSTSVLSRTIKASPDELLASQMWK